MADLINVNITQSADGRYSATVAEFPTIRIDHATSLEELREAMELAISVAQADGGPRHPVRLPPFVIGQVTRL